MTLYLENETSDMNGIPCKFIVRKEKYLHNFDTIGSVKSEMFSSYLYFDNSESPPLSESEIIDIHLAEEEFSTGQSKVFDDAKALIESLHAERKKYKHKPVRR